jgi:hypothetical protein
VGEWRDRRLGRGSSDGGGEVGDRLVAEAAGDLAGEYILHLSNRDFWPI